MNWGGLKLHNDLIRYYFFAYVLFLALSWLTPKKAGAEWVQFFATDLFRALREKGSFGDLARLISSHAELKDFARNMRDLIFSE